MPVYRKHSSILLILLAAAAVVAAETRLPEFGRDTVLVWNIQVEDIESDFVVRIAEFLPDRFLEWEDTETQGTVFMPSQDIVNAKGFVTARLFESGINTKKKGVTTLWLSERIYRELKEKRKSKCGLDGVSGSLILAGEDQITVEVNRSAMKLPAIKVSDDRGSERWFLDDEKNPLLLKHQVRHFTQTLTSITTNRPNTLRWIKGMRKGM